MRIPLRPQITNQIQCAQKLRIERKFLRKRPLKSGHTENFINTQQINNQKRCDDQQRCISGFQYLLQETIDCDQQRSHMNAGNKKQTAVYTNTKQLTHRIDKTMHCFRINTGRENLSLHQSVYPGMVRIHITKSIGMIHIGSV